MNPDEPSELAKKNLSDNNKSMILKVKNSSNQIVNTGPLKKLVLTRLSSLPPSTSLTLAKPKKSSESLLKSQQRTFKSLPKTSKVNTKIKTKEIWNNLFAKTTKLFSCISCQAKFSSILNLIQHVEKNQKNDCKTAYIEANQYEDLKKKSKIYTVG